MKEPIITIIKSMLKCIAGIDEFKGTLASVQRLCETI